MQNFNEVIGALRGASKLLAASLLAGALFGAVVGVFLVFDRSVDAVVSLRVEVPQVSETVSHDGYFIIETERRFGELLADALRQGVVGVELERETGISIIRVERITHGDFRLRMKGKDLIDEQVSADIERIINEVFVSTARPPAGAILVVSASPLLKEEPHSVVRPVLAGAGIVFVIALFGVLLRFSLRTQSEDQEF